MPKSKNIYCATKKEKGFTSLQLKNIAIVAMLIDHLAITFLKETAIHSSINSVAFISYSILRGLGRLTMPLMVFCLVEGFIYTRSLPKYLMRLFVFAIISHFPYVFFNNGDWGLHISELKLFHTSIIANFFLALLALYVGVKTKLNIFLKIPVIFILLVLSWFCDWSFYPIILAFVFYYLHDYKILKAITFIFTIPLWTILHDWAKIVSYNSDNGFPEMFIGSIDKTANFFNNYYYAQLFFIGLLLTIPFIIAYNGKPGKKSLVIKYFFYVFYPAHLLILGFVRFNLL